MNNINNYRALCLVWLLSLMLYTDYGLHAAEIYKYKDENGKWVFTDKPPESDEVETLNIQSNTTTVLEPEIFAQGLEDRNVLQIKNPLSSPIEVQVISPVFGEQPHRQTISALSTETVYSGQLAIPSFLFSWVIGDPLAQQDRQTYHYPVPAHGTYQITQAFNGRFSHSQQPSQYAVDIDMPVGTDIAAARAGTVIVVKDSYNFGGKSEYFLDKANHVMVLHDDGTYAVYAHILSGSVPVKPGTRVAAGSTIARSGSSGFSTGPHLHFAVLKNAGFRTVSVPFSFQDEQGKSIVPQRGLELKRTD